jgi:hypothetical protein
MSLALLFLVQQMQQGLVLVFTQSHTVSKHLASMYLDAAGRYRADFTYTVSGTSYTQSQYFNVYTPYIEIDDIL